METPRIQEFKEMVALVGSLPELFGGIEDIQIKLKGYAPDEIKFLADEYGSNFRLPDTAVNRYRTYFEFGNIWVVVMSEEYEINYSFAPVGEK